MKKNFTLWVLALLMTINANAQTTPEHYSRLKIDLYQKDIQQLAALGLDVDHGLYARDRFFIGDFSTWELHQLQAAGFPYEVLIEDVVAYYQDQSRGDLESRGPNDCDPTSRFPYATPQHFTLGSMGGFYTYEEMLVILDQMAAAYPELITQKAHINGYTTEEGRPIYWLKISDNPGTDEDEPEVFYNAVHHAREPNSLSQIIYFMWYLLENYETNDEVRYLVDNTEMYFVPCVNPDGYVYNQTTNPEGGGLWRKNRHLNDDGTYGVDLNRNYGFEWGYDNVGSSPNPQSQVYRGTEPFSERETRAIRDFCNAHHFKIALNCHTYSNVLVYPWGYLDTPTENSVTFDAISQAMIYNNSFLAGTGTETVGYTTNGTSDDWMYGDPAIFSMTPEVGRYDASGGFWPVMGAIENNCKATVWMNLVAALAVHKFGLVQEANSRILTSTAGNFRYRFHRHGLEQGPLTVGITPLSTNITSVGNPQTYALPDFGIIPDSISYTLASNVQDEEEVVFLLWVDNGALVRSDTVRLYYRDTPPVFADDMTTLDNWVVTQGSWGLTFSDYYSAPSSMTDSPFGDYNGGQSELNLTFPIPTDGTKGTYLSFWSKWEIEPSFDYAQVLLSVNEGTFFPLCGRYTVLGTEQQAPAEPVYEGEQAFWVHEWIDLTPFVSPGDQIRIQFKLNTDFGGQADGFYVDDVAVHSFDGIEVDVANPVSGYQVLCYPNPTNGQVTLQLVGPGQWSASNEVQLRVFDNLGRQVVMDQSADAALTRFNTTNWPAGTYHYAYWMDGQPGPTGRFVVVKY